MSHVFLSFLYISDVFNLQRDIHIVTENAQNVLFIKKYKKRI